jgi:hypothetical protein
MILGEHPKRVALAVDPRFAPGWGPARNSFQHRLASFAHREVWAPTQGSRKTIY